MQRHLTWILILLGLPAWMRMSTSAATSSLRVALLTDVEGNWDYVRNVARQSSCLQLTTSGQDETLELKDDCLLVFGGDAGIKETTHSSTV